MVKIAIKVNPKRGEEIIKLLKDLGGINSHDWKGDGTYDTYFIETNKKIHYGVPPKDYKIYSLEEFEKKFPFKIGNEVMFPVKTGWASGKVTGLTYVENQLKYEVYVKVSGHHYVEPHKLQLYPMKEERNITLTLDKAREWYNKGSELREVALQAFTEEDLKYGNLPKTWEEFVARGNCIASWRFTIPSKYETMYKLEKLRDCYNNTCNDKNRIAIINNNGNVELYVDPPFNCFLTFKNHLLATKFFINFKELIEVAKTLI